ncbi:YcjF family protein [Cochlodiniinecator piscidefendens]|uniref:YcjF family protein n=1 Tax=Cochlodiniinecator piscidefendens TaxID=2715756 RepID=UPI0014099571|nr:TIGR01620 family protein [Cochlodiniinecator piscidefendens]
MTEKNRPILFDVDDDTPVTPAEAPPVPEVADVAQTAMMQAVVGLGAAKPSWIGRIFWALLGALASFAVSLWAWDFVTGLLLRNQILGGIATVLVALLLLVMLILILREWAGFSRLRRLDRLQAAAEKALAEDDLGAARDVTQRLAKLYKDRDDLKWGRDRFETRASEVFDADGLLGITEAEILAPIDLAARREVEAAARQVATVTAIVPMALADLITALLANMRMIRRVAELYGGRTGTLGNWRLTRSVFAHLVATGAVAVGDDLIGSIAGGGVLSKISRRFGEGVINGALTARVGVAAIEVCRPLPFHREKKPTVTGIVQRALTGLFGRSKN